MNDPVAKRILDNVSETILPQEPKNESITTIYIGGINDKVSEYDLKNQFKSFGRIMGIKTIIKNNCAFVKLENRAACRAAIQELHRGFEINVISITNLGREIESILGSGELEIKRRRAKND